MRTSRDLPNLCVSHSLASVLTHVWVGVVTVDRSHGNGAPLQRISSLFSVPSAIFLALPAQEQTTDISRSLCRVVPGLARILLPRVNPFSLVGVGSSLTVATVWWMMSTGGSDPTPPSAEGEFADSHSFPDTVGGALISLMLCGTMMPMMLYRYVLRSFTQADRRSSPHPPHFPAV